MEIKKIAVTELRGSTYNPRVTLRPGEPEFESLRKSIREFGLVDPLIINKNFTVIGGHQRLAVLQDEGATHADCIVLDLTPERERALNVALNRIGGEWDEIKLKDVLHELEQSPDIDSTLTGFSSREIAAIMGEMARIERPVVVSTDSGQTIDALNYRAREEDESPTNNDALELDNYDDNKDDDEEADTAATESTESCPKCGFVFRCRRA